MKTMDTAPKIKQILDLLPQYDAFIIDIWGVLSDGIQVEPGAIAMLQAMRAQNANICLLSNSPSRKHQIIAQLEGWGIARDLYDHVITSGEATYQMLKTKPDAFYESCADICFELGGSPEHSLVTPDLGIIVTNTPENANFAHIAWSGRDEDATDINAHTAVLEEILKYNLPLICSNPDLVVYIGETLYICPGTIAAQYEAIGGQVRYHGKPHKPVYDWAYDLLDQSDKSKILAIGDSLRTDVAGAVNFGVDVAFNLGGIHREEDISDMLAQASHQPTFIIKGLE